MDATERQAWDECLALWKEMSNIPDTYTIRGRTGFKQNILNRLGIGDRRSGCPLCDKYYGKNCPIGDCCNSVPCLNESPYLKWSSHLFNKQQHSQACAKAFYEYLVELAEERGYYEN